MAISCSCLMANAQLLLGPKLGVQAGQVQFEKQNFQDQLDSNLKLGFNLGMGITFPVIQPFSLHSELLFSSKGKTINIPLESLKNVGNYYYLEMPIMMRFEVMPKQGIYLGLGPNLSYWLGGSGELLTLETEGRIASYRLHFGSDGDPNDLQIEQANRLQLGLLFSVGTLIETSEDRQFMLEVRYEMGHSFLGPAGSAYIEDPEFSDNLESKHRVISFSLGYFWAFHKKSARQKSHTYKAKQRKK